MMSLDRKIKFRLVSPAFYAPIIFYILFTGLDPFGISFNHVMVMLVSLVIFASFYSSVRSDRRLFRTGDKVTGVVTDIIGGQKSRSIVVHFQHRGRDYTASVNTIKYEVGDKVTLYVNPQDPFDLAAYPSINYKIIE